MRYKLSVYLPLMLFVVLLLSVLCINSVKVYAYSTDQEAINSSSEYTDGYQYSVIIKWDNGDYQLFYGNSPFVARYLTENGTIRITSSGAYYNRWYSGGLYSGQYLTKNAWNVIDGSSADSILYTNYDIYKLNATDNSATAELFYDFTEEWDGIYTYQYDSSIPNVKNMVVNPVALFKIFSWNVGQSKDKYTITWTAPDDLGLGYEIRLQSKYNDVTRRYERQGFNNPWFNGTLSGVATTTIISPQDLSMSVSLTELGQWMMYQMNKKGIDTGMYLSIPVTELYFRHYYVDEINHVVKYGNWCRIDLRAGAQGIQQARYDNAVITDETVDPDTGETIYTDTEVDGNETRYTDAQGDNLDESQSYEGIAMSVESALDNATTGIKSIASWLGQFPALMSEIFSFLPGELITFISIGVGMVIILRIAGR
jgi:hypothetical protein